LREACSSSPRSEAGFSRFIQYFDTQFTLRIVHIDEEVFAAKTHSLVVSVPSRSVASIEAKPSRRNVANPVLKVPDLLLLGRPVRPLR
jgi:hypothetical protein